MKNSKFIKAVAAITLSAVSAAACFGSVGCSHKHTYNEDKWETNTTHHWHAATCGHNNEKGSYGEHVWGDDNECDTCHYVRSSEEEPEPEVKIIEPTLTEADDEVPETDEDGNIISVNEFNPADIGAQTLGSDYTAGIFKVPSGSIIEGKNVASITDTATNEVVATPGSDGEGALTHAIKIQSETAGLDVTTTGAGTLKIWVSNGSSSASNAALLINGTSYSYGTSGGFQITYEVTQAGTYTIRRNKSANGTTNIHYVSFTAKVPNTEVDHIDFVGGTVDYYVGQKFDGSRVTANAIYKDTGRIEAVKTGRLKIDYSAFDKTKAGTYDIKVYYTKHEVEHEMTYKVNVYDFDSITFDTKYTIKEAANSAAGNGVYATHWLKDLYIKGAKVNDDGLIVILNGKLGDKTKTFALKEGQYTLSGADTSTTGKKTVTVNVSSNGVTKSNTFDIYVIESAASEVASLSEVKTRVNGTCTDGQIGAKNADNEYQFRTVRQALEFYEDLNLGAAVKKTINLDAGDYWEKLEVTIPNVTILGAGASSTKIEYNELWGVEDATGFAQTTDSTATLNIRDKAVNFTIKGVTISNYYNSTERYPAGADGRALAMLAQADKTIVQDCVLLGWQDTLELFTGRQYFVNTTIKGTTDFIFGTNNTTYFYQCNIVTVPNGSKGGYITAMKGQNKGAEDKITYGVIFDDCDFTYEGNVPNGSKADTAIGRTWAADAAVMIMNSRLGAHITKTESKRYISMNNCDPAKAQFFEYNNSGTGAVGSASNNYWTVPSAAVAANYNNLSVIFGKTNNKVTYSDVWDNK